MALKKSRKVKVRIDMTLDMGEPVDSVPHLMFILNFLSNDQKLLKKLKAEGVHAIDPGSTLQISLGPRASASTS